MFNGITKKYKDLIYVDSSAGFKAGRKNKQNEAIKKLTQSNFIVNSTGPGF